mmetsp:Transcript_14886/g.21954  ORF Transcript_14886/g.21954 Transcript_14886/m.21954 type:complete len:275 (-) Transcript_14886:260-1084(-)
MVEIEEIEESTQESLPSAERLRDAEEIESMLSGVKRPTVQMHLKTLANKLRKDSQALQRLEASQAKASNKNKSGEEKPIVEEITTRENDLRKDAEKPTATTSTSKPPATLPSAKYISIDSFAFDSGSYNSATVTIYISLDGVKKIPRDQIKCDFTSNSFDLIVSNLNGKSYRLFKDNLAHDIDPDQSKVVVKVDRLIIKLGKVKGEYGFDNWTELVDKKKTSGNKKDDPSSSIMNMMKDLYDSGDDNMRKVIGETMEKQRRGELGNETPSLGDM